MRLDLQGRVQAELVEHQLLPGLAGVGGPVGHAGQARPLLAAGPFWPGWRRRRRRVQGPLGVDVADQIDVGRQVPQHALAAVGAVAADQDLPLGKPGGEQPDQLHGQFGPGAMVGDRAGPSGPCVPWSVLGGCGTGGTATGRHQTLVGAQDGQRTIRHKTTQSCPQLTRALARLEIKRVVVHAGAVDASGRACGTGCRRRPARSGRRGRRRRPASRPGPGRGRRGTRRRG